MSHPARLSLRAPPHLPFIQGWPGIPSSPQRKAAAVHGTVEVRIGSTPIKAKWVRAEIRKFESAPPGFPSNGETWEHVGEIATLWSAPQGKDWETLQQADFKFYIPLPDNLPPTVEMQKGTGVRYELVAALCYRQKGGMFKKEAAPIMKISEPIRITKHDIHSAWPIFNVPDNRSAQASNGEMSMTVQRPSSGFGPTDRLLFTASLRSMRPKPFKLKGFECTLHEIVTVIPPAPDPQSSKNKKGKPPPQPVSKTRAIATTRHAVDETVGKGGEKSARIEMAVPTEKLLVTVDHARSLRVRFELEVKAVCDTGIPEIRVGGIKYTVGPFARSHAQQAVRDIGFVESLCPGQVNPANPSNPSLFSTSTTNTTTTTTPPHPGFTPSPQPSFPPGPGQNPFAKQASQPIQGFISQRDGRRKSSDTSTLTTTTTTMTHDPNSAYAHANGRPHSMHSKPGPGLVPFPSANPAPPLNRTGTGKTTDTSYTSLSSQAEHLADQGSRNQSEVGFGDDRSKRYSSATAATFGRWDKDLQNAMVNGDGSPVNPSSAFPSRPTTGSPSISAHTGSSTLPANPAKPAKGPPSSWPSAEQEKMRLYNDARSRAATAQQSTGASLHALGMDELASSTAGAAAAPPEYAPRRPELPKEEYKPPERPISVYTAKGTTATAISSAGQTSNSNAAAQPPPIAGDSGSAGEQSETSSPVSKPKVDQVYLSAAEEKEQQRKRFEAAQYRVVSGGSIAPSSAAASPQVASSSQLPSEDPVPYDAIFPAGPSSSATAGPSTSTAPTAVLAPKAGVVPGGLNEKEQMKRFYEAQDRVARAAARQSTGSVAPPDSLESSPRAGTSSPTPAPTVPLSGKEQMRRYYEAQEKVAQAGQAGGSGSGSGSQSSPLVAASTPPCKSKQNSAGPVGLGIGMPPASGLSEKEQMRRYYEAQDRVARSASGGTGSGGVGGPSTIPTDDPPPPPLETLSKAGPSASAPTPYLSADQEKEMIKKRYEAATAAVERNRNVSSSSNPPPFDSPPKASGSGNANASGSGSNGQYMSAAEEKQMMRKRFEDATAAVSRNKAGAQIATPSNSVPASPLGSPMLARDPTVKAGKAKAMSMSPVPTGPPPPLPTKPPKEYINLLSPVGEGPSIARLGGGGRGSSAQTNPFNMAPMGSVLSEVNGDDAAASSGSGSGR